MSDYIIDALIDRDTNKVYAVGVSTHDGKYVGHWEEPHTDVTAQALNDKDEARRIVNGIRAIQFR